MTASFRRSFLLPCSLLIDDDGVFLWISSSSLGPEALFTLARGLTARLRSRTAGANS